MADIRNDQYLHRPGAGRGAITPADPFEVLLYDGSGNPLLVKKPTGETRQALGVAGYGYDGTNWRPVKVNASGQAEVQLTGRIRQVVIPRGVYTTTQSVTVPVPDGVGAVIVAVRAFAVTGTFGVEEGWRLRTRPTVYPSLFLHAYELVSPVTTSTRRGWHVIGRGVGTESGDETPASAGAFLQRFQIPLPVDLEISLQIVGGTFGDGEGVDARVDVVFCW